MKLVRCHCDDCKEPVIGWRRTMSGSQIFLCDLHYVMIEQVYLDKKEKMGRF